MSRLKLHLVSLICLVLLVGVTSVSTPANAVGTVSVTAEGLRLAPGMACGDASYTISVPTDVPDWSIDVSVYAPDGTYAGGGYFYDGADSPVTTDYVRLCDYDETGTYTVVADVEARDANYSSLGSYRVEATFVFSREPMLHSRFQVDVRPAGAHEWTVTGRLTCGGTRCTSRATQVQVLYSGVWLKLHKKPTNGRGVVVWTTRPKPGAGRYRLRLYYPGTKTTKSAASRVFRLPAR